MDVRKSNFKIKLFTAIISRLLLQVNYKYFNRSSAFLSPWLSFYVTKDQNVLRIHGSQLSRNICNTFFLENDFSLLDF